MKINIEFYHHLWIKCLALFNSSERPARTAPALVFDRSYHPTFTPVNLSREVLILRNNAMQGQSDYIKPSLT